MLSDTIEAWSDEGIRANRGGIRSWYERRFQGKERRSEGGIGGELGDGWHVPQPGLHPKQDPDLSGGDDPTDTAC